MIEPVVLYVRHKGIPKMVGKVLPDGIFYHAAKPEQYHRNYACSFPVDAVVLEYLDSVDVWMLWCGLHNSAIVLQASVQEVLAAPLHTWGDRTRHYLSDAKWLETELTVEVPWITRQIEL